MPTHLHGIRGALLFTVAFLAGGVPAFAAAPTFDSGAQISTDAPYASAQSAGDVTQDRGIFGKLEGTTPVDIYSVTVPKGVDVSVSLLSHSVQRPGGNSYTDPVLILVDPTSDTQPDSISLPTPNESYHLALIHQESTAQKYTEPALFQSFNVLQQQTVSFREGKTYYLVVVPSQSAAEVNPYVIKFGTGHILSGKDAVSHLGGWLRIETGNYAQSSPFVVKTGTTGLIIVLLGLIGLIGMVLIQEILSLMANRNKPAAYLLIKLQPISRVFIWVGLWLTAIGGYILFSKYGWVGLPFVLCVLFVPVLLNMLYVTFFLSRSITQLEVSKKEATIPFALRKRWFFSSLVSLFSYGAFITYLSMYLIGSK